MEAQKPIDSNQALEEARATIASLQGRNDELLKALQDAKANSDDPELVKRVATLQEEGRQLRDETQRVQAVVSDTIESNAPLVQKAISATEQRAPCDVWQVGVHGGIADAGRRR